MKTREILKKLFTLLVQAKEAGYIPDEERAMLYEFAVRGSKRIPIDGVTAEQLEQYSTKFWQDEIDRRDEIINSDKQIIFDLHARIKNYEEWLICIARQPLLIEMTLTEVNEANFQDGYQGCVKDARLALATNHPEVSAPSADISLHGGRG